MNITPRTTLSAALRLILSIAVMGSLLSLAACGGSDTPESKPTPTATATPTPEPVTAYDEEILSASEKDIKRQMKQIVVDEGGEVTNAVSHCTPTSDRNYTCESSVSMALEGGFCGDIEATQEGYITDPTTGDYTWKNTDVRQSDIEVCGLGVSYPGEQI